MVAPGPRSRPAGPHRPMAQMTHESQTFDLGRRHWPVRVGAGLVPALCPRAAVWACRPRQSRINCTSTSTSSSAHARSAVTAGSPRRAASCTQARSPRDRTCVALRMPAAAYACSASKATISMAISAMARCTSARLRPQVRQPCAYLGDVDRRSRRVAEVVRPQPLRRLRRAGTPSIAEASSTTRLTRTPQLRPRGGAPGSTRPPS